MKPREIVGGGPCGGPEKPEKAAEGRSSKGAAKCAHRASAVYDAHALCIVREHPLAACNGTVMPNGAVALSEMGPSAPSLGAPPPESASDYKSDPHDPTRQALQMRYTVHRGYYRPNAYPRCCASRQQATTCTIMHATRVCPPCPTNDARPTA